MSTDPIEHHDGGVVDASDPDAVLEAAQTEANQIVAKARYEAFRMMTDARNEAEAILAGAEATAGNPQTEAASDLEEIDGRRTELIAETARLKQHHAELVEKVESTQALLDQLEERLRQIASAPTSSPTPPATAKPEPAIQIEVHPEPAEEHTATVLDYAPSVPHPVKDDDPMPPAPAAGMAGKTQGSFYTRRSAKLPSIGESRGADALSAMGSIRRSME